MKRELDTLITQMYSAGVAYNEAVRQFKRRYILEVLAHHKGNQCKAADELGMHRNTLSRTLAELEMDTARIRSGMRRPPRSERTAERAMERTMERTTERATERTSERGAERFGTNGSGAVHVGPDRPRTVPLGQRGNRLHNIA